MQTMDQHLAELVKTGRISYETGLEKCHHIEDFNRLAGRADRTGTALAMTTYAYAVRDRSGKMINGTLEADSPAVVASKLKGMGYAPITINEVEHRASRRRSRSRASAKKKVKLKDLAVMSRQFATMINSGLSLLRALSILVGADREQGTGAGARRGPQRGRDRQLAVPGDGASTRRRSSRR